MHPRDGSIWGSFPPDSNARSRQRSYARAQFFFSLYCTCICVFAVLLYCCSDVSHSVLVSCTSYSYHSFLAGKNREVKLKAPFARVSTTYLPDALPSKAYPSPLMFLVSSLFLARWANSLVSLPVGSRRHIDRRVGGFRASPEYHGIFVVSERRRSYIALQVYNSRYLERNVCV